MARKYLIVMLLSVFAPVIAAAQAKPTVKVTEDKPGLLKRAKVAPDSAVRLAEAAVPTGKVKSGEIEEEKGKLIYSFDIKVPGKRSRARRRRSKARGLETQGREAIAPTGAGDSARGREIGSRYLPSPN